MGALSPTEVEIDVEQEIEFPEICDAIEPLYGKLILRISNTAMIGGSFELEIEGYRGTTARSALLEGTVLPAQKSGVPVLSTEEYSSEEVRNLISLFPERIVIDGKATLSGRGTVTSEDSLGGEFEIVVPLSFRVEPDTIEFDPRSIEIDEDVRDELKNTLHEVVFKGEILTDLELRGGVRIYFGGDSAEVYTSPELVIPKTGWIPFGQDSSDFEVVLTDEDIDVFDVETLWVGVEVYLEGDEDAISIVATNYVRVNGCLTVVRRIEP